jgi:transcriptional regulator with XRE-family HTH domain
MRKIIGERLEEERERLRKKKGEMAVIGGVGGSTYTGYLDGTRAPDAEFLSAIAAAGADVLYILTGARAIPLAVNNEGASYTVRPVLSAREAALLDNYRHVDNEEDKKTIERVALRTAEAVQQQKEFEKQNWDGINRRKKASDK